MEAALESSHSDTASIGKEMTGIFSNMVVTYDYNDTVYQIKNLIHTCYGIISVLANPASYLPYYPGKLALILRVNSTGATFHSRAHE